MRSQLLIQAAVVSLVAALVPESREAPYRGTVSRKVDQSIPNGYVDHQPAGMSEETGLREVSRFARDTSGAIGLAPSKPFNQSFTYATRYPNKKNWIGIYSAAGGGPEKETYSQDSLSWEYAPEADGVAELSTANLPSGQYKAFFLANEGYKWLAQPIEFKVSGPWGSISAVKGQPAFTFEYKTPHPDPNNWIGIYHSFGGGPESQRHVEDSLTWANASGERGTVQVNTTKLQPGLAYKAFFLAQGGYKWLASPIDVFNPGEGALTFITDTLRTHNARQGEPFEATIAGLLDNPPDAKSKFAKIKNKNSNSSDILTDGWVNVSAEGLITGTPPASAGNTTCVVEALASDGSTAQMKITIPVVPNNNQLVQELTVLSFNLWFGGTQVKSYHAKQVRFIANSGADIVGLQESTGGHAIRLGKALGWDYWQGNDVGIISRYPMVKKYDPIEAAGSVRIALDKGHELNFWNCHLGYTPYGPYDFCYDHLKDVEVLENEEKSRRTPQIKNIVDRMKDQLLDSRQYPVILTGDFNAPSHLDWTNETKKLHCGTGYFPWPTSRHPVNAGLVDSFREIHPDPLAEPGITWSPIFLENEGRPEPKDRIDFIYHKDLTALSSEAVVVGSPRAQPDHYNNEWPSDHRAVKTVFLVKRDSFVEGGNSHLLWGIISAIIAATVGCASCIFCAWNRRLKSNKSPDKRKESESSDASGNASAENSG
ncbi:hypothetical protein QQS21_007372 [Conoideocrella luteorostrata]|uniref:Endonuclease/exonuclease/phosphatase domain-containing protein n=1 Tax=Conoideocrella luteorostrata TaxID=1105319 RepID=A0AAJ0CL03_9HYPO|nr:hypothetical protein QQS21_007372 [Conoideocrella luteorostrata]